MRKPCGKKSPRAAPPTEPCPPVGHCRAAGAKGIVHAGTGMGSLHKDAFPALKDAAAKGIVVVRAARVPTGIVAPSDSSWTAAGLLDSDTLNPQKSRILLQLGLTKTNDRKAIQKMVDEY